MSFGRGSGIDNTDMDWFVAAIPVFMLVSFIWFAFFHKTTLPPPPSSLTGCFSSPGTMRIRFDGKTIHFGQPGLAPVPYHLTLEKYGTIAIQPNAALRLDRDKDGSIHFAKVDSGLLYLMRLAHVVDGKAYGVRSAYDMDYIEVSASDGTLVAFSPTKDADCQAI